MPEPSADHRLCPTRANGAHTLIAHWITPGACLARQRANYHKCPTCLYRGLGADAVLPPSASRPAPERPSPEPVRRARAKRPEPAEPV